MNDKVETQEDLEREMTVEELFQVITDGQQTHSLMMQRIGQMITEASDVSYKIGQYSQLLVQKRLIEESEQATKQ
jgi:hypothetical protein